MPEQVMQTAPDVAAAEAMTAESVASLPSSASPPSTASPSRSRRIAFAALASWTSRAASILSGILLIPVLFGHLGKEELGVWLLLGQSWAVLGIFDFGFSPTIARRIALAKVAAAVMSRSVSIPTAKAEIADLFACAGWIYRFLAVVMVSIAWTSGYFYLRGLNLQELSWWTAVMAWTILCAGQAITVWIMVWTNLMIGLGCVGWETILLSAVQVITIAVQIGVSLAGGRLLSLAAIQAASSVIPFFLFRWFVHKYQPDVFPLRGKWNWPLVKDMIGPSIRCWLTTLGGVLIMQTDQFFVTQARGAAELPSYRAAYLLCINIQMLAIAVSGASSPFISQLWQANLRDEARRFSIRNLRFGISVVLCGVAVLLCSSEDVFTVWLGPGHFSGYGLIAVFSLIMLMETHSVILTNASRATEDEAFAAWGIGAGVLKLLLSLVFLKYFGLLGIPLGTLVAQTLTNYWYMAYRGATRLGISFRRYWISVVAPLCLVGGVSFLAGWAVREGLRSFPPLVRLSGVSAACGAVLLWSCWALVLDREQRAKILSRATLAWRKSEVSVPQ